MAKREVILFFRNRRLPADQYISHKVSGDRERMAIFMREGNPILVSGAENVQFAVQEIERAMEELRDPNGIWERAETL